MLKAAIFDMDGVIVDSEPIYHEVDKKVLKKCDFIVDDDFFNPYLGTANPEMWKDMKEKYNLILSVEELLKIQSELKTKALKETEIEAIDGVKELLNELKQNEITIALASSSQRFLIDIILDKIKVREYFKVIFSAQEVQRGKPHPDIFIKTAELLRVSPQECVVIEDSKNGIKAAVSAGMKCIGFANKNSGLQNLSSASAIVDSIREINYNLLTDIMQERVKMGI